MIGTLKARWNALTGSPFRRNALWVTGLSGFERVIAVAQTILVSRALGITEYGIYGLLFGTIGFVASIAGLQMALTATVFVSRYRTTEKAKAAAVISAVTRFGWVVALAFVLATVPFSAVIARHLFGSTAYQLPVLLGIAYVATTTLSSIQDGIANGFEIFPALAKVRIVTATLIFAFIVPLARRFGLDGVMVAVLGGLLLKYLVLGRLVRTCRREAAIPATGSGVSFLALVSRFAFPSLAASLGLGLVTWLGMVLLSKQPQGFDGVAMASTGLQWRGPILLVAASIETVAVPAFSRIHGQGDVAGGNALRRRLSLFNLLAAAAVCLAIVACAGYILALYGPGFVAGRLAFSLIVLSTIPKVVAEVHMQHLMGQGRMWRLLWLQCPYLAVMGICFALLVPRYHAVGYAASVFLGSLVFFASAWIADRRQARAERMRRCEGSA